MSVNLILNMKSEILFEIRVIAFAVLGQKYKIWHFFDIFNQILCYLNTKHALSENINQLYATHHTRAQQFLDPNQEPKLIVHVPLEFHYRIPINTFQRLTGD